MIVLKNDKSDLPLSKFLLEDVSNANLRILDTTVDSFYLDTNSSFMGQNGTFIFDWTIYPNIMLLVDKKVFGYTISFRNNMTEERTSNYVVSFYDDFDNVSTTGQKDLSKIINDITEPKYMIVNSGPSGQDDLSNDFSESYKIQDFGNKSFDYNAPYNFNFQDSSLMMLENDTDPDDAAQVASPLFDCSSGHFSLAGSNSSPYEKENSIKEKSFIIPAVGEKISLKKNRLSILNSVYKKVKSPVYSLHELSAITAVDDEAPHGQINFGERIKVQSDYFKSKRIIELSRSFIAGEELTMFVTPITDKNPDGLSGSNTEKIELSLSSKIAGLVEPEVPPEIKIIYNKPGVISYQINKGDLTAKEVKVTIRQINKQTLESKTFSERTYGFGSYNSNLINDEIRGCINKDPYVIIITAQTMSDTGTGLCSSSKVIKSFSSETLENYKTNFIKISAFQSVGKSIKIIIDQIHGSAKKIKLMREDVSVLNSSPSKYKVIALFTNPIDSEHTVLDSSTFPGKTYRYYTEAEYSSNQLIGYSSGYPVVETVESSDDAYITASNQKVGKYNVSLEEPSPGSFLLTASMRDSSFMMILNQLKANGLEAFFLEEIKNKRNMFSELFYFLIERIDRTTGDRVVLGHVPNGQIFTDQTAKSKRKYTYVFRLAAIDPQSGLILSNIDESVKKSLSESELNTYVNQLTSKISENTGRLESKDSYFKVTSDNREINASLTATEVTKTIPAIIDLTSPVLSFQVIPDGHVGTGPAIKLKWSMSTENSNLEFVDAFFVFCKYQGKTTVIQTVNCSNTTSYYSYVDSEYYNEIGQKEYWVCPRYSNYSIGKKSNSVIKNKIASIPSTLALSTMIVTPGKESNPVLMKALAPPGIGIDSFFDS